MKALTRPNRHNHVLEDVMANETKRIRNDGKPARTTRKVYVIVTSVATRAVRGSLLTDDGDLLWSDTATNIGYLQYDLTNANDRADVLAARFPDGFEVVVTPRDQPVPEEVRAKYAARFAAMLHREYREGACGL